ncbi:14611_t:CDS:2, partial [Racocetra fulgida]
MDPGLCTIHCADYLFKYAALTGGNKCRCGNDNGLDSYIKLTNDKVPNIDISQKLEIINDLYLNKDIRYKGCYKESPYCNKRFLNGTSEEASGMTIEKCLKFCGENKYKYAGLEKVFKSFDYHTQVGSQCFCDNDYRSLTRLSIEECSSSCEGNNSQICGGPLALSIYNASDFIVNSPPPGGPS